MHGKRNNNLPPSKHWQHSDADHKDTKPADPHNYYTVVDKEIGMLLSLT